MRNLKKILCLALVLSMVLAVVSGAAYTNYTDDAELTMVNEDYLLAAQLLQDIGVVVGVNNPEDGKTYYMPDQLLTRAELARVLYVLYSGTTDSSVYDPDLFRDELSTTFTDISGHWAEGYIKYGQTMGYLNGKSAEIFDPDANVKAQEMATALLIVLGYKAADLSPNYPVNVVKYGYTNNKGNLFTTGLSTAAASGGDHGMHIVGLGAAVGANEKDIEGEYQLERELTREEAFYMMYKAIAQRSMVSKRLYVGDNGTNVDGTYYYAIGIEYVNYKFNVGFDQTTKTDWVAGSNDIAFTGYDKALYNENNVATSIYTGNYGKAGYVYLDKTGLVQDFGYTAKQGTAQGSDQGFGYILSATDWNAQIGREIKFTLTKWNSKKFITEYAFSYGTGEKTAVRGFTGATLEINKTKKIEVNGDALVIDGITYKAYDEVEDANAGTSYYINLIRNNGVGVKVTADELLGEIYDADRKSPDTLKLYYKTTSDPKVRTLYGVVEEENIYAKVTISEDQAEKGKAQLNFLDDSTLVIKNSYELADGDRIFGYFDEKTLGQAEYDADAANFANNKAKAAKYDGMTLKFEKVAATTVENVVTVVSTDANSNKTKYFIEKADGVEFKMGKASKLADAYVGKTYDFKANETAYWGLYIVDGYCYEATKVATEATKDLYVTAVKKDVNTADNKVTYVFTLNTKANGTGDAYTFTKSDDASKLGKYEGIAVGDTVVYYYDAQTLAATGIKEFDVLTVTETEVLNADAFGNVDTKVALVADAIAKLAEVTDENIQYRIVLPAANAGQTLPVIFGDADQEANLDNAIAAAKAVAEVILPEYDYIKTETKVVNSVDSAVAALNSGAIDVVIVDAKVTSNPFNGKYAINNSIEFVDCTFSANMNYMYIKDATFTNCTFDCGSDYAAVHYDELWGDLVFNNCTFKSGKVQIGANTAMTGTVTFNDCEFAETATTSIWAEKGMRVYSPAEFNNCEFNNRVIVAGSNGLDITFNSCTMNGGEAVYYKALNDGIIGGGANVPNVTINN